MAYDDEGGRMARSLRIHVVDGWYHVMSRGNGGENLFRQDDELLGRDVWWAW
jgi:hypothetical protein